MTQKRQFAGAGLAVTAGIVLFGTALPSASARAQNSPPAVTVKAAKEARERKVEPVGWGEATDGLQTGLFLTAPKSAFRYGDILSFQLKARNMGKEALDCKINVSDFMPLTLGTENRIRIQTGAGQSVPMHLAPGEEKVIPDGAYRVRLQSLAALKDIIVSDPPDFKSLTLALQPGQYTLECPYPLWIADRNDPSRATAHRAKAGVASFTLRDAAAGAAKPGRNLAPPVPSVPADKTLPAAVQWGETVNGLQGGIAVPSGKQATDEEIPLGFYVRNTTDTPLTISYPNWQPYDWSPMVTDAAGKNRQVHTVFFTGMRGSSTHLLLPGETFQIGATSLRLQTEAGPKTENSTTPTLVAETGQYTVYLVASVRFAGIARMDMVLVTKPMTIAIP